MAIVDIEFAIRKDSEEEEEYDLSRLNTCKVPESDEHNNLSAPNVKE